MSSIRIGDLLVRAKVISESQLKLALNEQQRWGGKLGEILVRMHILTEDMLVKALSKQLNIPTVSMEAVTSLPPHVRSKVPSDVARDLVAMPLQLRDDGKTLVVAMSEPQNIKHLDTLRSVSRCRILPQLAGRQAIARAFSRLYEGEAELGESDAAAFKLVDAQGNTVIKSAEELAKKRDDERRSGSRMPAVPPEPAPQAAPPSGRSPSELLRAIEDAQRKEVAALKGMVELLIEKGVFTRDEYLAKVRR